MTTHTIINITKYKTVTQYRLLYNNKERHHQNLLSKQGIRIILSLIDKKSHVLSKQPISHDKKLRHEKFMFDSNCLKNLI